MLSLTLKTIIIFSLLLFSNAFALCSSDLKQAVNESEEIIATEYKTDDGIRQKIIDADKNFKKVAESYYGGDYDLTKEEYQKFLEKLKDIDIDPEMITFLLTDFENILIKLKNINDIETTKKEFNKNCNKNEISMDYNPEILDKWIKIYSTGKSGERIKTALEKSGRYREMIVKILREYDLPEDLQYLPVVESLFENSTVSRAKAVGLWQIMSQRGKALGLQINYWVDERRDPEKATRAAAKYLKELFILLNDWHLALVAYNRGEFGIIRDMRFSNASSVEEMKARSATPKETQNYVPQFIAAVKIAKAPEKYGIKDLKYDEPLQYDIVILNKVIDLKVIAKCANTTVEEIKELNPSIKAWCTPQGYNNFELKLPLGSKDIFLDNISKEKELNPSPGFIKHKVKKGEWLESIASKYSTSVKEIKENNPKLKKQKYIMPGQTIMIRPGRKYYNGK